MRFAAVWEASGKHTSGSGRFVVGVLLFLVTGNAAVGGETTTRRGEVSGGWWGPQNDGSASLTSLKIVTSSSPDAASLAAGEAAQFPVRHGCGKRDSGSVGDTDKGSSGEESWRKAIDEFEGDSRRGGEEGEEELNGGQALWHSLLMRGVREVDGAGGKCQERGSRWVEGHVRDGGEVYCDLVLAHRQNPVAAADSDGDNRVDGGGDSEEEETRELLRQRRQQERLRQQPSRLPMSTITTTAMTSTSDLPMVAPMANAASGVHHRDNRYRIRHNLRNRRLGESEGGIFESRSFHARLDSNHSTTAMESSAASKLESFAANSRLGDDDGGGDDSSEDDRYLGLHGDDDDDDDDDDGERIWTIEESGDGKVRRLLEFDTGDLMATTALRKDDERHLEDWDDGRRRNIILLCCQQRVGNALANGTRELRDDYANEFRETPLRDEDNKSRQKLQSTFTGRQEDDRRRRRPSDVSPARDAFESSDDNEHSHSLGGWRPSFRGRRRMNDFIVFDDDDKDHAVDDDDDRDVNNPGDNFGRQQQNGRAFSSDRSMSSPAVVASVGVSHNGLADRSLNFANPAVVVGKHDVEEAYDEAVEGKGQAMSEAGSARRGCNEQPPIDGDAAADDGNVPKLGDRRKWHQGEEAIDRQTRNFSDSHEGNENEDKGKSDNYNREGWQMKLPLSSSSSSSIIRIIDDENDSSVSKRGLAAKAESPQKFSEIQIASAEDSAPHTTITTTTTTNESAKMNDERHDSSFDDSRIAQASSYDALADSDDVVVVTTTTTRPTVPPTKTTTRPTVPPTKTTTRPTVPPTKTTTGPTVPPTDTRTTTVSTQIDMTTYATSPPSTATTEHRTQTTSPTPPVTDATSDSPCNTVDRRCDDEPRPPTPVEGTNQALYLAIAVFAFLTVLLCAGLVCCRKHRCANLTPFFSSLQSPRPAPHQATPTATTASAAVSSPTSIVYFVPAEYQQQRGASRWDVSYSIYGDDAILEPPPPRGATRPTATSSIVPMLAVRR